MITTHNKLKDHDNLKHERVNYECDKCDEKTSSATACRKDRDGI